MRVPGAFLFAAAICEMKRMKVCRVCHTEYTADDDFCPLDGSPLVSKDPGGDRVVVSWDTKPADEVPTRYVSIPRQPRRAESGPVNSRWLYVLLGGLAAVVIMGGGYLFFTGQREKNPEWTGAGGTASTRSAPVNASPGDNRNQNSGAAVTPSNANSEIPNKMSGPATNVMRAGASLERKFRRTYSGTLDTGAIQMDLERSGRILTGKIRPIGRDADIFVEGYIDDDGTFQMDEKSDIGVVTGLYRGKFNGDGTVTGTWSRPDGDKTRSLFLRRQ